MSNPSTVPNNTKLEKLTTRQQLDVRTVSLRWARPMMNRLACFALGLDEDPETGKEVLPMSSQQLKATEIILKKILPDQTAVQIVETDDFATMGRDEMMSLLTSVVSTNPELLQNPELREAVNNSQTVVSIDKNK